MQIHWVLGVCVIFSLASCSKKPAAESVLTSATSQTPATVAVEKLQYPTFEIFRSSRMFDVFAGDLAAVDLAELAKQAQSMDEALGEAERVTDELFEVDKSERPTAELTPSLPEVERSLYCLLPVVMMVLEPLWTADAWTAEQVDSAQQAAKIVGRISGSPKLEFKLNEPVLNRASLQALVGWFHATAAKKECLAAMIFTMDNGPYVGLPFETKELLATKHTLRLDDHTELRLAQSDRESEPCVMQCVRDGKPVWSRVISGMPDGEVTTAEFDEGGEAVHLGAHGWHVPFWVDWPMGQEQAHMYLDAQGELNFYFLSW